MLQSLLGVCSRFPGQRSDLCPAGAWSTSISGVEVVREKPPSLGETPPPGGFSPQRPGFFSPKMGGGGLGGFFPARFGGVLSTLLGWLSWGVFFSLFGGVWSPCSGGFCLPVRGGGGFLPVSGWFFSLLSVYTEKTPGLQGVLLHCLTPTPLPRCALCVFYGTIQGGRGCIPLYVGLGICHPTSVGGGGGVGMTPSAGGGGGPSICEPEIAVPEDRLLYVYMLCCTCCTPNLRTLAMHCAIIFSLQCFVPGAN